MTTKKQQIGVSLTDNCRPHGPTAPQSGTMEREAQAFPQGEAFGGLRPLSHHRCDNSKSQQNDKLKFAVPIHAKKTDPHGSVFIIQVRILRLAKLAQDDRTKRIILHFALCILHSVGQQPSESMISRMVLSVWRMPSLARRPTFCTVLSTPLVTMPSPP